MIRSLYRAGDGSLRTDLRPDEFAPALQDAEGILWVDLADEPPEVCEPILRQTFSFHQLAVEDALHQTHVPKVDDWGGYVYLVLHSMVFDLLKDEYLETLELDIFLGRSYLVTYHAGPMGATDRVWEMCSRDVRHLNKGADHLLYKLADELVAGHMPVFEEMDETLDLIEDQVLGNPTPAVLERILRLKRALLHMRRIITPQREVLNKLARDDYSVIDANDRIFFRDVYDHLVRLYDITESMRDLTGGALDIYLSVINNRMNDIMKTLTVITTLFMPISFIAGFFGMNFFQPVAPLGVWTGQVAFSLILALMFLTPLGMYLWIRWRAWM